MVWFAVVLAMAIIGIASYLAFLMTVWSSLALCVFYSL
jgi:hypothetical protein